MPPQSKRPSLTRAVSEGWDKNALAAHSPGSKPTRPDQQTLNDASDIKPKRHRATSSEMDERAEFLIAYAEEHGPVTVRQLYYQAEVHGLPGIEKTDAGYAKVQRQVLRLRREGRLAYGLVADASRWMRKPQSFVSVEQALADTAAFYRKSLWTDAETYVEIWCEKDALAGVILPITSRYDVPLMVTRGYSSETFCYEALDQRGDDERSYHVYYLGDFDQDGADAARTLEEKLTRFANEKGIEVVFDQIAVSIKQITAMGLPTRKPKTHKPWPYKFACELDAIPPDNMRALVEAAINRHIDQDQLLVLQVAEESEREQLRNWVRAAS
jgi:hypothetical protein